MNRVTAIFLFCIACVAMASATGPYYQKCSVKLPDYVENNHWMFETYQGYCYIDKIPRSVNSKEIMYKNCISIGQVNYCNNQERLLSTTKLSPETELESYWIVYNCNVYNGTEGRFFYSGRVWPEYVKCY